MLASVFLAESLEYNYYWPCNYGNSNRHHPLHSKSHPPIPNGNSVNSSGLGFRDLLLLALADCGAVEIFLAVSETDTDGRQMALEADVPATGHILTAEVCSALLTGHFNHHLSPFRSLTGVMPTDWHPVVPNLLK